MWSKAGAVITAITTARPVSDHSMIARLGRRSAATPPKSIKSSDGARDAMKTAPIARTEPVNCNTAKAHGDPKDAATQQRNKLPFPKQGEAALRDQDSYNR